MPAESLTVTWRLTRPLPAAERDVWESLVPRFSAELSHPGHVELVVTDQYQAVAGEYAVQSPTRANEAETADDYQALKPDGAMAAAKTVDLPDGKDAVIADAALVRLGQESAWRMLLHEAQHVRLHQSGDQAWGVHRRVPFTRPDDLTYEFIWFAEIVIDEFRCELAVHEAGVPLLDMGSRVSEYEGIVAPFEGIRQEFHRTGNVLASYHAVSEVAQRLNQFLAYGAANTVFAPSEQAAWASVAPMVKLLRVMSEIPSASSRVGDEQLAAHTVKVARTLRRILQDIGFDLYFLADGSLYFKVL